ncbi:MAG: hypothetical protein U7M05_09405 [Candidatus Igneacidithiobacillus chanchocoensis]
MNFHEPPPQPDQNPAFIQSAYTKIRAEFFEGPHDTLTARAEVLQKEVQIAGLCDTDLQAAGLILHCFERIKTRTAIPHYPAAVALALGIALSQIPQSKESK